MKRTGCGRQSFLLSVIAAIFLISILPYQAYGRLFDPSNQTFHVIVYDSMGNEPFICAALDDLGVTYTVRSPLNPLTVADLDASDILIVGWNFSWLPPGPDSSVLAAGIKGRVLLTGHDPDPHIINGLQTTKDNASRFLAQAIRYVVAARGCGLIAVADGYDPPLSCLPPQWGIDVVGERNNKIWGITSSGQASGVYEDLTPDDMGGWYDACHNRFLSWGSAFVPFEMASWTDDIVTIARTMGYGITLTKTTDIQASTCVTQGDYITYSLTATYPDGSGPSFINDVTIVDTLPGGVNFSTASTPYTWSPQARTVMWHFDNIAKASSKVVTLKVQVNSLVSQYSHIHNTSTLTCEAGSTRAAADTTVCSSSNGKVYVNWDAAPGGDGSSWLKAFRRLQDGLAAGTSSPTKTVWVAQGTYRPGSQAADSFVIPAGVQVYGGFVGVEGPGFDPNLRNLEKTRTILDGTIYDSYRNDKVVTMGNNSLLDGCIVQEGGVAAIYGQNGSFEVLRCQVLHNTQDGIYIENGNATINWCRIQSNKWNGIYADNSDAPGRTLGVGNCHINRNLRNGILANYCVPTIRNSVITQNGGEMEWGVIGPYYGIDLVLSDATIRNCTITSNARLGISAQPGSVANIRNCILWANSEGIAQTSRGLGISYSCVMNDANHPNNSIDDNPIFGYSEPNVAYHLMPNSPCINSGDNVSAINYSIEKDIDGDDRLYGGRVDMGADEATCSEVYNICDWNLDGEVTLTEYAVFAMSWQSHDPCGPAFDHSLWPNPWNAAVNLVTDYVVDMKDFRVFSQKYPWVACWRHDPPAGLTMEVCTDPNIYHVPAEPNEPGYDPNDPGWDPNDPNGFGMLASSTYSSQMGVEQASFAVSFTNLALTAQELQENITFLYQAATEENPETAAAMYDFIGTLEQELCDIYGTRSGCDFTQ